jgi:hypothetical protein
VAGSKKVVASWRLRVTRAVIEPYQSQRTDVESGLRNSLHFLLIPLSLYRTRAAQIPHLHEQSSRFPRVVGSNATPGVTEDVTEFGAGAER